MHLSPDAWKQDDHLTLHPLSPCPTSLHSFGYPHIAVDFWVFCVLEHTLFPLIYSPVALLLTAKPLPALRAQQLRVGEADEEGTIAGEEPGIMLSCIILVPTWWLLPVRTTGAPALRDESARTKHLFTVRLTASGKWELRFLDCVLCLEPRVMSGRGYFHPY